MFDGSGILDTFFGCSLGFKFSLDLGSLLFSLDVHWILDFRWMCESLHFSLDTRWIFNIREIWDSLYVLWVRVGFFTCSLGARWIFDFR